MECPECREDMLQKIAEAKSCAKAVDKKADSKLGLRNFGIAAFTLTAPMVGCLIGLYVMVANCAQEDEVYKMTRQADRIEATVDKMATVFEDYMRRTEKRDDHQDEEDEKAKEERKELDGRIRDCGR